ncbi:hypothetical protein SESBI_33852 [Sesbania bispinosa]|nr:hypothetical protein SESBI_33852 [Sesbania bispinosa]
MEAGCKKKREKGYALLLGAENKWYTKMRKKGTSGGRSRCNPFVKKRRKEKERREGWKRQEGTKVSELV